MLFIVETILVEAVNFAMDPNRECVVPSELELRLGVDGVTVWNVAQGSSSEPAATLWLAMQDYAMSRGQSLSGFKFVNVGITQ